MLKITCDLHHKNRTNQQNEKVISITKHELIRLFFQRYFDDACIFVIYITHYPPLTAHKT